MSDEKEQLSEVQQEIQQYFWFAAEHLIKSGEYSREDVIQGFYRSALVAYMRHQQETNGDIGVEEIAKYLKNCRVTKHDTN